MDLVTGIILAGGQSSRMGQDKALLEIGSQTLLQLTAQKMEAVFRQRALVTGEQIKYADLGWEIILDQYPGCGPLGGIQAALSKAKTPYIFVVGCDMPWIKVEKIQELIALIGGEQVIIPQRAGQWEPLFALYHQSCLKAVEEALERKQYRIRSFLEQVKLKTVAWEAADLSLSNVNTPQDWAKIKK